MAEKWAKGLHPNNYIWALKDLDLATLGLRARLRSVGHVNWSKAKPFDSQNAPIFPHADGTVSCGPFTWKHDSRGGPDEVWELVIDPDACLTRFCVKNYGGEPNDENPFSGWRLVSGGPFRTVGGWTSRDAAIRGVTCWLIGYIRRDAETKAETLRKQLAALATIEHSFRSY
jgi:hypothetical protein